MNTPRYWALLSRSIRNLALLQGNTGSNPGQENRLKIAVFRRPSLSLRTSCSEYG
jgi:hypothetical protein